MGRNEAMHAPSNLGLCGATSNEQRATSNEPDAALEPLLSLIPKVVRRLVPPSDRDDIAQDLCIAIWTAISHGSSPLRPLAYLRAATVRLLLRSRRAAMARPIPVDPHLLSGRARPEAGASGTFDCESERSLVKARLDARRRRVYELIFEQGLSVRATAAALGCAPGQVRRDLKTLSAMASRA